MSKRTTPKSRQRFVVDIKGANPTRASNIARFLREKRDEILSHIRGPLTTAPTSSYIHQNEFAPLLATICDEHIRSEDAWGFPEWLDKEIKGLTLENVIKLGENGLKRYLKKYLKDKWPKRMREERREEYLKRTAKRIMESFKLLKKMNKTPATLFENREYSAGEVYFVLRQFSGIGPKKASMITRDFLYSSLGVVKDNPWFNKIKDRNPEFKVTGYITPPIDVHVVRVFCRLLGLERAVGYDWYDVLSNASVIQDVIVFSILTFPDQPYLLDEVLWNIGKRYCRSDKPDCHKCILRDVCGHVAKRKTKSDKH